MTIADYQAQTAANLKRLQDIKLDLSVLESLEDSEEPEGTSPASPRNLPSWLSFGVVAAIAGAVGVMAGIALF